MEEACGTAKSADVVLFDSPFLYHRRDDAGHERMASCCRAGGHTSRDHLQRAKEKLEKAHVHIIGVALTHAPTDRSLEY
jgi:hypothetical protein